MEGEVGARRFPCLLCGVAAAFLRRSTRGWRRRSGALWRGALPLGQGLCGALRSAVVLWAFAATFLRRFWLRQQPRGCLRRPRRDRGIASSPYSLLGFSSHPFVPPPLRYGVGGGRARRSGAARWRCFKGFRWLFAFFRCFTWLALSPAQHPAAFRRNAGSAQSRSSKRPLRFNISLNAPARRMGFRAGAMRLSLRCAPQHAALAPPHPYLRGLLCCSRTRNSTISRSSSQGMGLS